MCGKRGWQSGHSLARWLVGESYKPPYLAALRAGNGRVGAETGFVVFVAKWGFGTNVKKDGTYVGAREGRGNVILWRKMNERG